MMIHDEFVEILRILAEDPQHATKKPPSPDRSGNGPENSGDPAHRERKEAAS